jgi:two-component system sensor histidine kinase BaeS
MNKLWVRLSFAFGIVLIVAFMLAGTVMQQSLGNPEMPPPPEVIAFFEQVQAERDFPQPLPALAFIAVMAIIAGVVASRMVASPMSALEKAAQGIGQGDLSTRVEPRGSQEMVAVAAAFNNMASQLEQAESMRKSLLADVAHELRHPLHVLQGNLQAMQDGVYPINDEEIERLLAQTHHLTVMVSDLHVLAQAEAQRLPLHMQDVDIAGLVKEVASDFQPLAQAREIELKVALLGTMPQSMRVDKARIRQALQNLLDNALRHTPDGREIDVSVWQLNGRLQIQVQDSGDGIDPQQLPLVFDRLYRGDVSRQRQGSSTGLGLAISKALVDAHGGTITAESAGVDQGSTFTIELPVQ